MTITTLGINDDNDLYLGVDGNIVMKTDIEAVRDICLNVARTQKGELIYNTDQGIPNFETVWRGNPNLIQFENALRENLAAVEGVKQILDLGLARSGDVLNYKVLILTIFGEVVINGSV